MSFLQSVFAQLPIEQLEFISNLWQIPINIDTTKEDIIKLLSNYVNFYHIPLYQINKTINLTANYLISPINYLPQSTVYLPSIITPIPTRIIRSEKIRGISNYNIG